MKPSASIIGGSMAGLFAATALLKKGWDISVHEKVPVPLSGRGAGIATYDELADLVFKATNNNNVLGTTAKSRVSLDINGKKFSGGFCLNVGNPHIVFFVDDCFKYDLKVIGPLIENHELFPEKTNVTFAQILDRKNILVNVWERGAGLTKACGTAACATAVAGKNNKLIENEVAIKFKKGILNIVLDEKNNIFMSGPVSEIKNIKVEI